MSALSATAAMWLLLIIGIALDACVHPLATATATSAETATGAASVQAAGGARAMVKRGARHLHISVPTAADGGATFELDLADDAEEIDTSAAEAIDAGAASTADAGSSAGASVETGGGGLPWKFILGGLLVLLIAGGIVARKVGLL